VKATATRQHPDQTEVKVVTVSLPNGKVQEFQRHSTLDRVYAGTQYWTGEQFEAALEKMRAAGAAIVESTGYVFE
jgi:hypothetical protein